MSQSLKNGGVNSDGRIEGRRRSWAWFISLCYLLALPLLALQLSADVLFGQGVCNPRPVGSFGTIFNSGGYLVCQLSFIGILLYWTLFAGLVSSAPILIRLLYTRARRKFAKQETIPDRAVFSPFKFALFVMTIVLLAVVAGWVVYQEARILAAALVGKYPTGDDCLCIGVDLWNYGGQSNSDGIAVCCTVFIDQALYSAALFSLPSVAVVWLGRHIYNFPFCRRSKMR